VRKVGLTLEASVSPDLCPVVELRRYALRAGERETLIELFDREFVETQEAVGMRVLGQFRDLDDPDSFVWLRGFDDMETRERALAAFYGGPAWKEHARAANATMIDSDDVLLLRPARPESAFALDGRRGQPSGFVTANVVQLEAPAEETGIVAAFQEEIAPTAPILGCFVTEPSENTFPALPVREGEEVFVWFEAHADRASLDRARVWDAYGPSQVIRLEPTTRSLLHGGVTADPNHGGC